MAKERVGLPSGAGQSLEPVVGRGLDRATSGGPGDQIDPGPVEVQHVDDQATAALRDGAVGNHVVQFRCLVGNVADDDGRSAQTSGPEINAAQKGSDVAGRRSGRPRRAVDRQDAALRGGHHSDGVAVSRDAIEDLREIIGSRRNQGVDQHGAADQDAAVVNGGAVVRIFHVVERVAETVAGDEDLYAPQISRGQNAVGVVGAHGDGAGRGLVNEETGCQPFALVGVARGQGLVDFHGHEAIQRRGNATGGHFEAIGSVHAAVVQVDVQPVGLGHVQWDVADAAGTVGGHVADACRLIGRIRLATRLSDGVTADADESGTGAGVERQGRDALGQGVGVGPLGDFATVIGRVGERPIDFLAADLHVEIQGFVFDPDGVVGHEGRFDHVRAGDGYVELQVDGGVGRLGGVLGLAAGAVVRGGAGGESEDHQDRDQQGKLHRLHVSFSFFLDSPLAVQEG